MLAKEALLTGQLVDQESMWGCDLNEQFLIPLFRQQQSQHWDSEQCQQHPLFLRKKQDNKPFNLV